MALELTYLQNTLLDVVRRYPGEFSRSGLAKMLVGARSWQDTDHPDYGGLASYRRKDIAFQVDILLQQGFIALDGREHLIPISSDSE